MFVSLLLGYTRLDQSAQPSNKSLSSWHTKSTQWFEYSVLIQTGDKWKEKASQFGGWEHYLTRLSRLSHGCSCEGLHADSESHSIWAMLLNSML